MTAGTEANAAVQRLMMFLGREGAEREPSSRAGHSILRSSKGTLLVADHIVDTLRGQGAVSCADGRVTLTKLRPTRAPGRTIGADVARADDRGPGLINLAESPLCLLASRRGPDGRSFLAQEEVAAGERLRADYTRAQLVPHLGVNWDLSARGSGPGTGRNELSDSAIDARTRVEAAIDAVGPELAGVLVDICCFLKGVEQVERERRWPVRSAKLMLKAALGALARHYAPTRRRARNPILNWGSEGYRPTIGGGA
jgi:hypothetical protein